MKRVSFSSFMLVAGLLFIYLPMLILVIYSFNESKLVTVWGGWSIKWYVGLLDNTQLMGSVARSLEIACYTAVAAVALGTLAAFVLTRISQFKGRTLFGGLVTAPLVMPEVITGLSLLLLFVAMAQMIGWPQERGIVTTVAAVRGDGADDRLAPGTWHRHHLDRPHHLLRRVCGGGGVGAPA